MKRREAIVAIALFAAVSRATAQPAGKIPRVGVLHPGSSKEAPSVQREPFERGLRELNWVPGTTVLIDYRYAEGNAARLSDLAVDLVRSGVDVIVARSPAAIHAARRATTTIPIVMSAGGDDPVAEGLVKNLSRPGGNVTGIVSLVFELDSKRLELLKETFPAIRRVAVLANPDYDAARHKDRLAAIETSARSLKLQIEVFDVRQRADIADVFAAISRARIDALLVQAEPQVIDHNRGEIAAMAAKHRLPAIYPWRFFVEAGGLMSYGTSLPGFHYRSATFVSRILKGANLGDLAIERPTKFDLVVNLKAAKALAFELPKALLFRADELMQ